MGRGEVDSRGFTLLEVMVVIFILALTASVVTPAIGRSTDAIRVRAKVGSLSALLRHAREEAIGSRKPLTVAIDPVAHRVSVLVADTVVRSRALPANWTIDAAPPGALTLHFDPQGTTSGAEYRIVAGSISYRITVNTLTGRVRVSRE
jgi:type II secretion system protein H